MRGGEVVRLRLSPADAMGVVDLMQLMGVRLTSVSLSSAASLAITTMLEEMRVQGKIPRRMGFEYSAMMEPMKAGSRKEKLIASDQLYHQAMDGNVPSLADAGDPELVPAERVPLSPEEVALLARQWAEVDGDGGLAG